MALATGRDRPLAGIDTRRSFTETGVFLVSFQDVVIDLTQTPPPPNETWPGTIYSLRLDPVVRFLNESDLGRRLVRDRADRDLLTAT